MGRVDSVREKVFDINYAPSNIRFFFVVLLLLQYDFVARARHWRADGAAYVPSAFCGLEREH